MAKEEAKKAEVAERVGRRTQCPPAEDEPVEETESDRDRWCRY